MSDPLWHTLTPEESATRLDTDLTQGLSAAAAAQRAEEYGPNELAEEKGPGILAKFVAQFQDFLVIVLVLASILSFFLGEVLDGAAIIAIVLLNAVLGVVQEFKADQALANLKRLTAPHCRVVRDGETVEVDSRDLVPGDLVSLEAGDPIPADLRLTQSVMLQIDESLLTGESVPVEKEAQLRFEPVTALADRRNLAYMSTAVTYGHGLGVVIATGMSTEVGRIAGRLQQQEQKETPLQRRLGQFGRQLGMAMLVVCALVGVLGLWRGYEWLHVLMVAISLAVAAIPEGLPAVVTIVLALGTQRMARRNAVVRRLSAVETLGSATVICSDKTGTLTQNRMTVTRTWTPDGWREPSGEVPANSTAGLLLMAASLCNDASLSLDEGEYRSLGDPTETALVIAAAQAGLEKRKLEAAYPRVAEVPFSSERKRMTTIHRLTEEGYTGLTKGGPDVILSRCSRVRVGGATVPLDDQRRADVEAANHAMAQDGIRVLAVAISAPWDTLPEDPERMEADLELIGLLGMTDPPREESAAAVAVAKSAGIRCIMITGDHVDTATAIARQVGMADEKSKALTGVELDHLDDDQLDNLVGQVAVYARVSPEHKLRIVDALRRQGEIVAMTGDGVNDAPALKKADIGVAMGLSGTGVAKGAADMVLMDDNFATIVSAIEEGRTIYANIQKFAFFLLSANLAELLIMTIAVVADLPLPLEPIHLLWINLITDSLPAIALGLEPTEPGTMSRKPRNPKAPVLGKALLSLMGIQGLLLAGAVLTAQWLGMSRGADSTISAQMGATYAFVTLSLAELWWAHGCRNIARPVWRVGLLKNRVMVLSTIIGILLLVMILGVPALGPVFQVLHVAPQDWLWILILSLSSALLMEPFKATLGPRVE